MVFCNTKIGLLTHKKVKVTILILIDGFLQLKHEESCKVGDKSHNPYFNRWFSAINLTMVDMPLKKMSQSLF